MSETTSTTSISSEILSAAVDRGASDVHLKAGRPPIVRFDGELEPLPASRRSARSSWRTS